MMNSISLRVSGHPDYIQVCSSTTIAAANIAGFDIDTVDEMGMAVVEGCKMISCHDSCSWCSEYIINMDIDENTFTIVIQAIGDHCLEKTKKICTMCPKEGDLGLAIINSVMDKAEFSTNEEGKRKLTMIKSI